LLISRCLSFIIGGKMALAMMLHDNIYIID